MKAVSSNAGSLVTSCAEVVAADTSQCERTVQIVIADCCSATSLKAVAAQPVVS